MPEDKNAKTVDIDTSGPEVDVELNDDSVPVQEFEVKEETVKEVKEEPSSSPQETKSEKQEASDEDTDKKKDELQDYSEGVQRRIAKLTKKMREAERQREDALTYAQAVKAEKEILTKRFSSLETTSLQDKEAKIKSALEAAKGKLGLAREAGDIAIEVEVQKEIARLGYEEARLDEMKSIAIKEPVKQTTIAETVVPRQNYTQTTTGSPRAESWGAKNKWFGTDKPMTYTAFDIHKTLVDDEGYDTESDEYYTEIDRRIRLEFPNKFDKIATTETTKPTQVVASAKRSVKPGRKTVRLTPSQVAIAKKLGVPLEEYAKQLNITKEV